MRSRFLELAVFGLLAGASPSIAETKSFELGGRRFQFDIPSGYVESVQLEKIYPGKAVFYRDPASGFIIWFSSADTTADAEYARLKALPDVSVRYAMERRVGYVSPLAARNTDTSSFHGEVFAGACHDTCIVKIQIMHGAKAAPQSSNIGYDLLEKYERALAAGDFGGD